MKHPAEIIILKEHVNYIQLIHFTPNSLHLIMLHKLNEDFWFGKMSNTNTNKKCFIVYTDAPPQILMFVVHLRTYFGNTLQYVCICYL